MKRVYLCGPIAGLTATDAKLGWRQIIASMLSPDIHAVSPMRAEPDTASGEKLSYRPEAYASHPMLTADAITARDRFDVMRCDMVVANLTGGKISMGSMIELGWADAYRKPVVAILTPEDVHWHVMVQSIAAVIAPDLKTAATTVNKWLSEGL